MSTTGLIVSIVEPVGGHRGMDYYDFALCYGLAKAGVKPTLFTCNETEIPPNKPFQVVLSYRDIYGSSPAWLRGMRYLLGSLRSFVSARKLGAKICHLHFFSVGPLEYFNVLVAKIFGMRIVLTLHDVQSFVPELSISSLVHLAYQQADAIIVHNETSHRELLNVAGSDVARVSTISSGNYFHAIKDNVSRPEARNRLKLPPDCQLLLFFGQIKEVKGLDVLIRALPRVTASNPNAILIIAGPVWKDDFSKYQQIIDKNGLADKVLIHAGFVPDHKKSSYFKAADLVVLPYRKVYQSAVLLMAMSFGTAVLASDLEPMREVIGDNETGFLFPSNDSKALANRITEILADQDLMDRVARNGLQLMREKYDWLRIGKETAECYQNVLE